jgi:hypothetical protein
VINLTYHNGLMVPARNHISPLSFHEAVVGIHESSMISLFEASGDQDTWGTRAMKILKTLINKVLGFFKKWFDRTQAFKDYKTSYILKNKGIIYNFSVDTTIDIPMYLTNPRKTVDNKTIQAYLATMNGHIETAIAGTIRMDKGDRRKVVSAHDLADEMFTSVLGGTARHNQDIKTIETMMYGEKQPTNLATMDKKKLVEAFLRLDSEFSHIVDIKNDVNVFLTKLMSIDTLNGVTDAQNHRNVITYIVNTNVAFMKVCDTFLSIDSAIYNHMYEIMVHMINVSGKGSGKS